VSKDTCHKNQRNSANPALIMRTIKVKSTDCPLACPMPDQSLWNMHPRVYLAIEETGKVACPYCGTQYTLEIDAEDTRAS
jgi:uncharacterized Zn-finger protein